MTQLPSISFHDVAVEPGEVDLEVTDSFVQYVFPKDSRSELTELLEREKALIESIIDKAGMTKNSMAALEALAPNVSTLRRYNGVQKVRGVVELVRSELEAKAYEKIVIFAIHRDVIRLGQLLKLA